jgi:hypothetical protein
MTFYVDDRDELIDRLEWATSHVNDRDKFYEYLDTWPHSSTLYGPWDRYQKHPLGKVVIAPATALKK